MNVERKEQLENGDIVTLRNGDKLIYCDDNFTDMYPSNDNHLCDEYDLQNDMKMKDRDCKESDIMKVERPISFVTVFSRDEKVKEMTVEEISEALGYEVKVVKE